MESFVAAMGSHQIRLGHRVQVITLDHAVTNDMLLPEGSFAGLPYRRLRRIGPRRYPFARGLVQAIQGADLVHAHGLDGLADAAVATRRIHGARVGVSTHGGYFHTSRHSLIKAAWLRTGTKWVLRNADAVWFSSGADVVSMGGARAIGPVMDIGVDLGPFLAVKRRPERGTWLVMGRVDAHKGIDDLIDLVATMSHPPTLLVLGGESAPGLINSLRTRAVNKGVVAKFEGNVEQRRFVEALASCELAVFPSRSEAFGMASVEALASGAPVVLSEVPAFQTRVEHGRTGFIVNFRAEGAAEELSQVRQQLDVVGERGRDEALRYGWDNVMGAWMTEYRRALS